MAALKLPLEKHSNPYQLGWIRVGEASTVTIFCVVHLLIGKLYAEKIRCDVVDMDATHVILGRPWQYDTEAVYRGKLKQYIIQMWNRRVTLMPLPPETEHKKVEANFLIQSRSEFSEAVREEGGGLGLVLHSKVTNEQ